jgi:hypothetical protein
MACAFGFVECAEYIAPATVDIALTCVLAILVDPGQGLVGALKRRACLPRRQLAFGMGREIERQCDICAERVPCKIALLA